MSILTPTAAPADGLAIGFFLSGIRGLVSSHCCAVRALHANALSVDASRGLERLNTFLQAMSYHARRPINISGVRDQRITAAELSLIASLRAASADAPFLTRLHLEWLADDTAVAAAALSDYAEILLCNGYLIDPPKLGHPAPTGQQQALARHPVLTVVGVSPKAAATGRQAASQPQ